MSEEDIDVVRRAIDALNRRDVETSLTLFHADAELDWTRSRGLLKGIYRGHAGLVSLWEEFWVTFEDLRLEVEQYVDAAPEVLVPNTGHLRGRDGMEVAARSTLVYTVRDGRMSRLRLFQEYGEALEAVSGPPA